MSEADYQRCPECGCPVTYGFRMDVFGRQEIVTAYDYHNGKAGGVHVCP